MDLTLSCPPVKCFTCGRSEISERFDDILALVSNGYTLNNAFNECGLHFRAGQSACCRKTLMTFVNPHLGEHLFSKKDDTLFANGSAVLNTNPSAPTVYNP